MSEGENKIWVRENTDFFFCFRFDLNSLKKCRLKAAIVITFSTKYGEEVLLNDTFRFCSNNAFNIKI